MSDVKHEVAPAGKNPGHRWGKGQTGNPHGRPKKPEAEILRVALESDKKKNGNHLIEHAIAMSRRDNALLAQILKKILPDKIEGELGLKLETRIIIE